MKYTFFFISDSTSHYRSWVLRYTFFAFLISDSTSHYRSWVLRYTFFAFQESFGIVRFPKKA